MIIGSIDIDIDIEGILDSLGVVPFKKEDFAKHVLRLEDSLRENTKWIYIDSKGA